MKTIARIIHAKAQPGGLASLANLLDRSKLKDKQF